MSKRELFTGFAPVAAVALIGALVAAGCRKTEEPKAEPEPAAPEQPVNLSEMRRNSMLDPEYNAKLKERLEGRGAYQAAIAKVEAQLTQAQQAEQPDAELIKRLKAERQEAIKKFVAYERESQAIVTRQVQKDLLDNHQNFQQKGK